MTRGAAWPPGVPRRRPGALEPFHPAGKQQQAEANNPRPGRNRCAQADYAKLREQSNNKQDQGNHPDHKGWSFARKIAHGVFLVGCEMKQLESRAHYIPLIKEGKRSETFTRGMATAVER